MPNRTSRVSKARIDALVARNLLRPAFGAAFLRCLSIEGNIVQVNCQRPHPLGSDSIDLWLRLADHTVLILENKFNAAWNVTDSGEDQPARHQANVDGLRLRGICVHSVLLAPRIYLAGGRQAVPLDRQLPYEILLPLLAVDDQAVMAAAIRQAATPYEPMPDPPTVDFILTSPIYAFRQ